MTTNKTGMILYWIAVVLIIGVGLGGSWVVRPIYRNMTLEQANQTIWGLTSPLFGLWASSVPIGSMLAGTGDPVVLGKGAIKAGGFSQNGCRSAVGWLCLFGHCHVVSVRRTRQALSKSAVGTAAPEPRLCDCLPCAGMAFPLPQPLQIRASHQ